MGVSTSEVAVESKSIKWRLNELIYIKHLEPNLTVNVSKKSQEMLTAIILSTEMELVHFLSLHTRMTTP